ncbi:hypothetical protein ACCO45_003506 [Purpureocillium lilacinum]|uniref:Uncharacterized protein n=1 Tax=Purpureocillium lilacinum TaxID=33203 RepID=A0ACC4E189_PURLI
MGEPSAIGFTLMRGGTLSDPPGPPTLLVPQQREPTDRLSPNHTTSRRARRNQPGQSSPTQAPAPASPPVAGRSSLHKLKHHHLQTPSQANVSVSRLSCGHALHRP